MRAMRYITQASYSIFHTNIRTGGGGGEYVLPLSEPWPAPARLLCTIHNKVAEVFVADL